MKCARYRKPHSFIPLKQNKTRFEAETDEALQALVKYAKIVDAKDQNQWNWAAIQDLVSDHRLYLSRTLTLVWVQKALRRLVQYYRPSQGQYSGVNISQGDEVPIQSAVACTLFKELSKLEG